MTKKKTFTTEDLVTREVIRPNVPLEWLSKISFKEFNTWAASQVMVFRITNKNPDINELLEAEIRNQERLYQLLKSIKSDKKKGNGLPKHQGRDVCLGGELKETQTLYDLQPTPSHKQAVLKQTGTRTMNGRIYPEYTLEEPPMTALDMIRHAEYDIKTKYGKIKDLPVTDFQGNAFEYRTEWRENYVGDRSISDFEKVLK